MIKSTSNVLAMFCGDFGFFKFNLKKCLDCVISENLRTIFTIFYPLYALQEKHSHLEEWFDLNNFVDIVKYRTFNRAHLT